MHLSNFLKRKFSINKKSQAQHVVELAMMMPLFIILFSYTFQLMVETYSKYRFSYIFTNSVRNVINHPVIYKDIANISDYRIENNVYDELKSELVKNGVNKNTSEIPFTDIFVDIVNSDETVFFKGAYQLLSDKIFFGQTGKEYFYFTIPVNKIYTEPIVLNKTTHDVESYFNFYFKYYSDKYFEADDSSGGTTEGDGTEEGTEGGDTTEGGDGTEGEGSDGGDTSTGEDEGITGSLEDGSASGGDNTGGGSDGGVPVM